MTKKNSTKRSLILSALSLLLCFSMLIGTTFAWFTDEVSSKNNIIIAGNLDVELYYQNDETIEAGTNEGWETLGTDTNVFKTTLWEPGHTEVIRLKVVNEGTLALKYMLGVNIVSETGSVNVYGDPFFVSDYIKFGIDDNGTAFQTREKAVETVDGNATALNVVYNSGSIELLPGQSKIVTMVVYMPTSVENEANYAKGEAVPTVKLGINLYATQLANEEDSFGKDYDHDAVYDAPGVLIRDDMTGTIASELKNNTALDGYRPENLPDNTELIIELADVNEDTGACTYSVTPAGLVEDAVTFRLPIQESYPNDYISIELNTMTRRMATQPELYEVKGEGTEKYVEVTTDTFGTFVVGYVEVKGSGTYGGIDWTLYEEGTLVIEPASETPALDPNAPTKRTYEVGEWREAVIYKSNGSASAIGGYPYDVKAVKHLVIKEGVTTIGSFAAQFPNLTGEVIIPSTVTYIGQEAFHKAPITKLTFAEGGTEPLCIANGAFKKTLITEISFPGDREYIHIHHWAFGGSTLLETAYIPANVTKSWGGEHVDYFDNFNSQTNVTWAEYGSIFTGCTSMKSITFENEEVRDLFFAKNRQSSEDDYIVAYVGLTAYNTLEKAIEVAQDGDTVVLVGSAKISAGTIEVIGKNITVNRNGKTLTGTITGEGVTIIP